MAPTSGEYLLDDIPVRTMSKPQRAVLRNRKIGFVFQSYNLLPKTTAVENVELPLMYNSAVSASERRHRAIESLQAVGLGDRLEHKSNQMSGGQMQRVAIARALVNNPAVILAARFFEEKKTQGSREQITAELVYYWMIALNIPFECQKWHLNKLFTLIRVCDVKSRPPKKHSRREIMKRNAALNAARKKKWNTKG